MKEGVNTTNGERGGTINKEGENEMPPFCNESETDLGLKVYGRFDDKEKQQFVVELTERQLARLQDLKNRQFAGLTAAHADFVVIASIIKEICVQKEPV